ncbi:MAG: 3-phosphoshikimate 1-carboxyvinyltransferase [Ruminococcaceae bacterium]|nr:3-phosphoshikimate 1-carboxyvinyltransferase [Oscillospiraceae bacterium]
MDIQITPAPISGSIEGIASKSFAHRALICACLAKGKSQIRINTTSADIEATLNCLRNLGAVIEQEGTLYSVTPIENIPKKASIDCGESGSTIRFLLPVICALGINTEIHGSGRLPERPLSPLKEELIRMGAYISDDFPLNVSGRIMAGEFTLRGDVSSQFVTGLLMALAYLGGGKINLLPPVQSRPYIDITLQVLRTFGADIKEENNTFYINPSPLTGCGFTVEADWSNAAFPLCMGAEVTGLNPYSTQGDKAIIEVLKRMGAKISGNYKADVSALHGCRVDAADIPDAVPVIAAIAATAEGETVIFNGERLRIKESDRIQTTCEMLRSLGADITETDDGMIIRGKKSLSGGETLSFHDHRIAMAAAVAAVRCEGDVIIRNAEAVNKSYPAFFKDYNKLGGNARVL